MGNLGAFASRFSVNTKSLEAFDEALRFLKEKEEITKTPEMKAMVDKLLNVIDPILESIKGNLSESTAISERRVIHIIKERHNREWPTYRKKIQQLHSKLNSSKFKLSESDLKLLNDIADALDAECANLFRRMSER